MLSVLLSTLLLFVSVCFIFFLILIWGFQLSVGELVLSEILAKLVEPIYSPEGQFWHLDPSIIHSLSVHHDNDQMQRVFFETSRKAWSGCWSYTSFEPVKAFAEELVGVSPEIFSSFIIDVFTFALVSAFVHNVSNNWILHRDTCQLADICGRWFVIFVRQTMRVGEVSRFKTKSSSVSVHLLDEVFHWLIARDSPLVNSSVWSVSTLAVGVLILLSGISVVCSWASCRTILVFVVFISGCHLKKVLSKMFSEANTCIVTTREHKPM